jgi:hypothetical protein
MYSDELSLIEKVVGIDATCKTGLVTVHWCWNVRTVGCGSLVKDEREETMLNGMTQYLLLQR